MKFFVLKVYDLEGALMASIAEIYEAHAPKVYWSAYSVTHDESAALDVMQSVFLRALEHESTLVCLADAQAKAWLYTAAKNAGIDYIRKRRREVITGEDFDMVSNDALPDDLVVTNEMKSALCAAIDTLPELYRQPVILYYFAEMKHNEIAAYLGENHSTIRSRLKRAKAQLYSALLKGGELLG